MNSGKDNPKLAIAARILIKAAIRYIEQQRIKEKKFKLTAQLIGILKLQLINLKTHNGQAGTK